MSGGVAAPVVMVPLQSLPPTDPTLPAPSDSESEVSASDEELLTPKRLLSKVRLSDEVEHMLDKGVWAMTPVTCIGCKIFVDVSQTCFSLHRSGTDRCLSRGSCGSVSLIVSAASPSTTSAMA